MLSYICQYVQFIDLNLDLIFLSCFSFFLPFSFSWKGFTYNSHVIETTVVISYICEAAVIPAERTGGGASSKSFSASNKQLSWCLSFKTCWYLHSWLQKGISPLQEQKKQLYEHRPVKLYKTANIRKKNKIQRQAYKSASSQVSWAKKMIKSAKWFLLCPVKW